VEAQARVLRAGRTTLVLEVDLVDVGIATMSFSVLPRRDANLDVSDSMRPERTTMATATSRLSEPIHDAMGAQIVGDAIEVPVTDWAKNSMDAMQGGLVALLADLAGERALGKPVNDLHIVYLGFGRVGPIRAQVEQLGPHAARVEVIDKGADNRRMAIASVAT
jgi:acyl-coenzyme A thioesterase PaaI-like protein